MGIKPIITWLKKKKTVQCITWWEELNKVFSYYIITSIKTSADN